MFEIISENVHHFDGQDDMQLFEEMEGKSLFDSSVEVQAIRLTDKVMALINDTVNERLILMRDVGVYQDRNFYNHMRAFVSTAFRESVRTYFK